MASTFERLLNTANQRVAGFDLVRLVAAIVVLFSHSFPIVYGNNDIEPLYRLTGGRATFGVLSVWTFFSVSGFVIAASVARSPSLIPFLTKRCARIFPALFTVVIFSVAIFGPLLTSDTFPSYITNVTTYRYLGNIIFVPSPGLPGVLGASRFGPTLNGSLWTLRHEFLCYLVCFAILSRTSNRSSAIIFLISAGIAAALTVTGRLENIRPHILQDFLSLYPFFASGSAIYICRAHVIALRNYQIFVLIVIEFLLLPYAGYLVSIIILPIAILSAGINVKEVKLPVDISYGVYLWAFPIEQMVAIYSGESSLVVSGLSLAIVIPVAILSFLYVEKPCMDWAGRYHRRIERFQ